MKSCVSFLSKFEIQGEPGANQQHSFSDVSKAISAFEKKFRDKTRNSWKDRANFEPRGKYTMIEVEQSEDVEDDLKKVRLMRGLSW